MIFVDKTFINNLCVKYSYVIQLKNSGTTYKLGGYKFFVPNCSLQIIRTKNLFSLESYLQWSFFYTGVK
jgi:hypothetical protein